jgi:hypothetical protein
MNRYFIFTILAVWMLACSSQKSEEQSSQSDSLVNAQTPESSSDDTGAASTSSPTSDSSVAQVVEPVGKRSLISGKVKIDMLIENMKKLNSSYAFKDVEASEFNMTNNEPSIKLMLASQEGVPQFIVQYTKASNAVKGITILSPNFEVEEGVHVGMTYDAFVKIKPKSELSIDAYALNIECIYVPEMKYRVEFLTSDANRIGKYNDNGSGPVFSKAARPDGKVDRISMY